MTEEMKAKREYLKLLSKGIKQAIETGEIEADTVNAGLVEHYKKHGHTEIHSFKKWLEMGKVVKKGEKALLLWGEPKRNRTSETGNTSQAAPPKTEENNDDGYEFYPLAYVFSQQQVEPLRR